MKLLRTKGSNETQREGFEPPSDHSHWIYDYLDDDSKNSNPASYQARLPLQKKKLESIKIRINYFVGIENVSFIFLSNFAFLIAVSTV